jgi:hypothetical protein
VGDLWLLLPRKNNVLKCRQKPYAVLARGFFVGQTRRFKDAEGNIKAKKVRDFIEQAIKRKERNLNRLSGTKTKRGRNKGSAQEAAKRQGEGVLQTLTLKPVWQVTPKRPCLFKYGRNPSTHTRNDPENGHSHLAGIIRQKRLTL